MTEPETMAAEEGEERLARKFVVLADGTEGSRKALFFAARRAKHAKGRVVLLHVIEPPTDTQWLTVEDAMREEAYGEARDIFTAWAEEAFETSGGRLAEFVIREGHMADEVRRLLMDDPSIEGLVLTGRVGPEGPGGLVEAIVTKHDPDRPISVPVTIIPDRLSYEELRQVS
jgi:nucleotide-binding universal stress UspA family protein